jgi:hypothetical protein
MLAGCKKRMWYIIVSPPPITKCEKTMYAYPSCASAKWVDRQAVNHERCDFMD